ncbi:uncharacterized protein ELE39_001332 [Cryptosporidium sp. chipmunk genotype I]|uniref:uncharacterized protein n=1 Tax=Cryptosporidium sp. chipmunk genotype I TaxID=1280935 RepID=UPI00351AA396|nr:hypothetical protein ELE39_001332 [Cryptosporidium sp. chipmunk genotype I]
MYKYYFSLFSFFTFSLILTGCYFNWENNYGRFAFKILKDVKVDFAFDSYISKENLETEVFGKGHEILLGESRNDGNQENLLENSEDTERSEGYSGEILDLVKNFIANTNNFFSTFRFPVNLNPRGFSIGMRLKYRMNSDPIKIIFIGRDLRNLLNIIIKECRIYLFSKDKSNGFLYDSSPLFISKNSSEDLQLIMDWTENTFRVSAIMPDNSQVALGSIVKTDSPLIASGSAYVGEALNPLQVEWNFKNRPLNARFECLINYFEERCKSNSIQMSNTSDKNFPGLKADRGFLKIAFQFPPKERLPVSLRMMEGEELALNIQFSLDQMVIHESGKSFKHFFLNRYQEGEWLNLDLVPISNLSLSYLTLILKTVCSRKIFELKSTSGCFESNLNENNPTRGSCENEFLQNIARSGKILGRVYGIPNSQEFETFNTFNSSSGFKLLMAIDEEIIGKQKNLVF